MSAFNNKFLKWNSLLGNFPYPIEVYVSMYNILDSVILPHKITLNLIHVAAKVKNLMDSRNKCICENNVNKVLDTYKMNVIAI